MAFNEIVSLNDAVDFLNNLIKIDGEAIGLIVGMYAACNERLADHPTVQVVELADGRFEVGFLGILNGLFGIESGRGPITLIFGEGGRPIRAVRTDMRHLYGIVEAAQ
jgi:hypothetical protein